MSDGNRYADYINRARSLIDFGDIEGIVEWKHGIIEDLREACRAVRAGNSNWPSLVKTGITRTDDIFGWRDPLNNWFRSGSEEALIALRALWSEEPMRWNSWICSSITATARPMIASKLKRSSG